MFDTSMSCRDRVHSGPGMFDCRYCNTRHLLVVNQRTIPQKIAGQNFPFDAHCPNSNMLIYLKD